MAYWARQKLTSQSGPPLSQGAKDAVKSSGGWTHTVQSFGGKAHDSGDIEETRQIVEKMAHYDAQQGKSSGGSKGKGGKK